MKPRALITDSTHPVLAETLRKANIEVDEQLSLSRQQILDIVDHYDIIVVRSKIIVDREFIDKATKLKCIGRIGAGMETIDTTYATSKEIVCLNSPEGNRDAVGEHCVGLLLALFNHIASADKEVRSGIWHREANRGIEICGKTIGIIGYGNMGQAFAKRLSGFNCRVVAYDKYRTDYGDTYAEACTLEHLQQVADVVSLHVPLTDETHHMVDADFINNFSHPIYLINSSRGAVVNTEHLVAALKSEKILGAALDVLEYEDLCNDSVSPDPKPLQWLKESNRTVLSPHVAGWTVESKYKLAAVLADKIIDTIKNINTITTN